VLKPLNFSSRARQLCPRSDQQCIKTNYLVVLAFLMSCVSSQAKQVITNETPEDMLSAQIRSLGFVCDTDSAQPRLGASYQLRNFQQIAGEHPQWVILDQTELSASCPSFVCRVARASQFCLSCIFEARHRSGAFCARDMRGPLMGSIASLWS
jgi:hypothetical protein